MLAVLVLIELSRSNATVRSISVTDPLVAAVLYLGVLSTAIAWVCWYKGLERSDTGTVAVSFFAQPVVGAALGVVFLGESVGTAFLAGGGLLALGVSAVMTSPSS